MRRRVTVIAAISLLTLCASRSAEGQASPAGDVERRQDTETHLLAPSGVADAPQPGIFATFLASADEKIGSARANVESVSGAFVFHAGLSGPLDASTREAQPFSLLGLTNGGAVDIGLHWLYWAKATDFTELARLCRDVAKKPVDQCDDSDFVNREDRRRFNRAGHATDAPWIVDVTGSVSRNRLKFLTTDQLQSKGETHSSWNLAASVGRYHPRYGYLKVQFGYQRNWEAAGPAQQVCQPIGAGALRCTNAVLGAPSRAIADVLAGEWRYFLPGMRLAVNPAVQRDLHDAVTAVQVPFFFLSNKDGGLAGGARWGWRSDTRESTVVVFIGTILQIIG